MRIVTALGSKALLLCDQELTTENLRENIAIAAEALAQTAMNHQLIVTHGSGPQVSSLAWQDNACKSDAAYPLEVRKAETERMIGFMIEQELRNRLPQEISLATLFTTIEVDANDPSFSDPTKFIGPVYDKAEAEHLAADKGWEIRADGDKWRRVVACPAPRRILQTKPITWLVEKETVVICAGGGVIPTAYDADGDLPGIETVIDKDLASELLARDTGADLFISATDTECLYLNWGTKNQRGIKAATPDAMRRIDFLAGSMGPKIEAACRFVHLTGNDAAIGALADLEDIVAGRKGTTIRVDAGETVYYDG